MRFCLKLAHNTLFYKSCLVASPWYPVSQFSDINPIQGQMSYDWTIVKENYIYNAELPKGHV